VLSGIITGGTLFRKIGFVFFFGGGGGWTCVVFSSSEGESFPMILLNSARYF